VKRLAWFVAIYVASVIAIVATSYLLRATLKV
jgi:hypothetical protein